MPPAYTTKQRQQIQQFVNFTQVKDPIATKELQAHPEGSQRESAMMADKTFVDISSSSSQATGMSNKLLMNMASRATLALVSWITRGMNQWEKNDILQDSDDDKVIELVLRDDRMRHPREWPDPPDAIGEDSWRDKIYVCGPGWNLRKPQSLEQSLKWGDLRKKGNAVMRVCNRYIDRDMVSLANVALVTSCFALGRPLMPQGAVLDFIVKWGNMDLPLSEFPERSRSSLRDNLAGKPPRNHSPSHSVSSNIPSTPTQEQPKSEVAPVMQAPIPNQVHTHSMPQFSPIASLSIGGGRFTQSFPPPLLGFVLGRIVDNYAQGAYDQEYLMDIYMQIMSHPRIPKVRHAGRELFDRIRETEASDIRAEVVVLGLLNSLGLDPTFRLSFDIESLRAFTGSREDGPLPMHIFQIVVHLVHCNVESGDLSGGEALAFFKAASDNPETPFNTIIQAISQTFHVPLSYYIPSGLDVPQGTGSPNTAQDGFRKPPPPSLNRKRLDDFDLFPVLDLDGDSGSSSPEDGVTEDMWGLLMPSRKARALAKSFNLGRVQKDIHSKTPRRDARVREKILVSRKLLKRSTSHSKDTDISGDSLFALPGEDTRSFLDKHPVLTREEKLQQRREGTPFPGDKPSTSTQTGNLCPDTYIPNSTNSPGAGGDDIDTPHEVVPDEDAPYEPEPHPTCESMDVDPLPVPLETDRAVERRVELAAQSGAITPPSDDEDDIDAPHEVVPHPTCESTDLDPIVVPLENDRAMENSVEQAGQSMVKLASRSSVDNPGANNAGMEAQEGQTNTQVNDISEPAQLSNPNKPSGIPLFNKLVARASRRWLKPDSPIDRRTEDHSCLHRIGDEFTQLQSDPYRPTPFSVHAAYYSGRLREVSDPRPTRADIPLSSYFQSPQAASSTANSALNKIFDTYRGDSSESPDMISIDGAMKYLPDIGVQLDEVACFAILELLQAPSMGEFTRSGFLAGWKSVNCETIKMQAAHAGTLRQRLIDEPDYFRRVYRYTFPICRLAGQKILPLEIAAEQWRVFFTSTNGGVTWNSPTTPWLDWWIEFLTDVWKRPINKDLWEQTEVLMRKTKEDENFGWWSAEGAWPGAVDDFVGWVRAKRGSPAAGEAMDIE